MDPNSKFLFSETDFDRSTKIRENSFELDRLLHDHDTKHILIWRGKILFDFSSDIPHMGVINRGCNFWEEFNKISIEHGHFVGFWDKNAIFYHDISVWNDPQSNDSKLTSFVDDSRNYHPALPSHLAFCELRSLITVITKRDAAILASIKGIYEWNKINTFCNKCGNKTHVVKSGWEKICYACDTKHFPRTDPVVIMMVFHQDKALLGRSSQWPKGMFSCLAGFMEPGESIEAAVARETFEETGVSVKNTKYVTSQPWPFPASLMIGCIAEATSLNILIDKEELEEARWFQRDEIRKAINAKGGWWPAREGSIARFLINQWVNGNI